MTASRLIEKLSKYKNIIFLAMCLGVHAFNAIIFLILGYQPLVYVNLASSAIYIILLCFYHKTSENVLIVAYYEIIIFCLVNELFIGDIGYLYFIVGMIGVICYLLPSNRKYRHMYQVSGFAIAMTVVVLQINNIVIFKDLAADIQQYKSFFKVFNVFVTLFTVLYCSSLYLIDLNKTKEKLDYNSNHDMLTGLYNRRFLNYVFERNNKEQGNPYAITMFDIDDFKSINDTYGHAAGDLILENLSEIMRKYISKDDLAVRWGGEEFIIYMPNTRIESAYDIVNKIVTDFRNSVVAYNEYEIKATITAGIAMGNSIKDYEKVIIESDQKLYKGKHEGKDCIIK